MATADATGDRRHFLVGSVVAAAGAGAAVFAVALLDGGYGLTVRAPVGAMVWWAVVIGLTFGLLPLGRVGLPAIVVATSFAILGFLALASAQWGASGEDALDEFNRTMLYTGVFVLVTITCPLLASAWQVGLATAIVATSSLALGMRLAVPAFGDGAVVDLAGAETRLSDPIGYWNGLGIFAALGIPLILSIGTAATARMTRIAALAAAPVLASVIFLASSRGGALCAFLAVVAFLLGSARRWTATAAVAIGACGSGVAVLVLDQMDELVNGPFAADGVAGQALAAGLALAAILPATGLAFTFAAERLERWRPRRGVGVAAVIVVTIAVTITAFAADPRAQWDAFREPPMIPATEFTQAHLASQSGNGRSQFWSAGLDEFAEHSLAGGGAGSFESWWAEHGSLAIFVRNAHSLYVETLAELGLLGGAALAVALVVALVAGVRYLRAADPDARDLRAGAFGATVAFLFGVGVDWLWELTVVGIVGIACLALIATPSVGQRDRRTAGTERSLGIGASVVVAGWVAAILALIPLLAELQIRDSHAAAAQGDTASALASADTAKRIAPWAAEPYLQRALVLEQAKRLDEASASLEAALRRDSRNWRLWLIDARIDAKRGRDAEAAASLGRAASLNPRSPLFDRSR